VRFLDALFPDAIFLHVIRDPRTHFLSLVEAKANSGEQFWGIKVPGWRAFVGAPVAVQAVLQMQRTLELLDADIQHAGAVRRYVRVRYETLVAHPVPTLKDVVRFCGLDWSGRLEGAARGVAVTRQDERLPANTPEEVRRTIGWRRDKLGYARPSSAS
jgi:hypothetical protein